MPGAALTHMWNHVPQIFRWMERALPKGEKKNAPDQLLNGVLVIDVALRKFGPLKKRPFANGCAPAVLTSASQNHLKIWSPLQESLRGTGPYPSSTSQNNHFLIVQMRRVLRYSVRRGALRMPC